MIIRSVLPPGDAAIDTADPDARDRIAARYPRPGGAQSLRVNLVATSEGAVQGENGGSGSLSSTVDRMILGAIRSTADAVLVGAQTLRSEGYLLPRRTPLVVLTRSGELAEASVDPGREHARVIVAGPEQARTRAGESFAVEHEFLALHGEQSASEQLPGLLDALAARGFAHLVCEGGPALADALIGLGLVDELCLTTSPRPADPASAVLDAARTPAGTLVQLLEDEAGYLFARRRLR